MRTLTSFESGNLGGIYTDPDYNTTHDLVNQAGMAEVNYDTGTVYSSAAGCPEGGLGSCDWRGILHGHGAGGWLCGRPGLLAIRLPIRGPELDLTQQAW